MTDKKIEILAPAGSRAAFEAALKAGANAVYAGGSRFSARAYAENFTEEELIQAIHEAHFYGRKLYLTVNTLLKEEEIETLYDYLAPYYENGLDAVIVQDMGAVDYIRRYFPELDIHASTQMTITGALGAKFVESQGMTRVVPARELSLEEISLIRRETDLEIECFVHGALCYCYSGQCLLSSMIGGRSGNRGQCAQPCRLPYTFNGDKKHFLSPKDICTLEIIPELIEAGIDSFKIEGRMKKPEYVAGVTALYRKYTDLYLESGTKGFRVLPEDRQILMDLYNRGGFSSGYYQMRNGREMMSLERPNHAGVPAVKVRYQKGREVHGVALTDLGAGDVLDITGGKSNHTFGNGVKKGEDVSFLVQKQVHLTKGMILNRIRNESLLQRIETSLSDRKMRRPVSGKLILKIGSPAHLHVTAGDVSCQAVSDEPVQAAQSRPMDRERICTQIKKTGNSEFFFEELVLETEENIFFPVGQLNLLRRRAFEELKEKLLSRYKRECGSMPDRQLDRQDSSAEKASESDPDDCAEASVSSGWFPRLSVYAETTDQLAAAAAFIAEGKLTAVRLYLGTDILASCSKGDGEEICKLLKPVMDAGIEIIAALPHICRSTERDVTETLLDAADELSCAGVLLRSCEEYQLLKERGFDKKIILDHNLYVFNRYAKGFWNRLGITEFTAPLELDERELSQLQPEDCELEIYGRAPVMVSAQCLFKTSGTCRKQSGLSYLTDRRGSRFPVRAYCDSCYNVIYNEKSLSLMEDKRMISRLKPYLLRIRFSTENAEETAAILSAAAKISSEW